MSKSTGGPAFPVAEVYDERGGNYTQYASEGMTLRDYFAAKAMLMVNGSLSPDAFSKQCYRLADAMLAERAK